MKTIAETKQYLQHITDYRQQLEAVHKAGDAVARCGLDKATVEDPEMQRIQDQVAEAVRLMTRLDPAECQVLLARYVDGTKYEALNTHPYLSGMSNRQSWRLLARATEHYAELLS